MCLFVVVALNRFCKSTLLAEFTGVTNDNLDISVDRLKYSTLEIFRYFGVEEGKFNLDIIYRGAQPGGGGKVRLRFVPVRSLQPVQLVQFGMIKRIRGYAYATKVSPQFCNRMITSARALLNEFIPDVRSLTLLSFCDIICIGLRHDGHTLCCRGLRCLTRLFVLIFCCALGV